MRQKQAPSRLVTGYLLLKSFLAISFLVTPSVDFTEIRVRVNTCAQRDLRPRNCETPEAAVMYTGILKVWVCDGWRRVRCRTPPVPGRPHLSQSANSFSLHTITTPQLPRRVEQNTSVVESGNIVLQNRNSSSTDRALHEISVDSCCRPATASTS